MLKEMSTESVSHNKKRHLKYKMLSTAFSYPDDVFFDFFPQVLKERKKITAEYDLLFRSKEIWLYTTEYTAEGDFQKCNHLADIMGFYKAFGLELDRDRPDALFIEMEFMHYLIFKEMYALEKKLEDSQKKASICFDAQKKFFNEYLYPGAKAIAEKIILLNEVGFYRDMVNEMIPFLEEEKKFFENPKSP